MDEFISKILEYVTAKSHKYSLVVNPDGFLKRPDTQQAILKQSSVLILPVNSSFELRIHFELYGKSSEHPICYIIDNPDTVLPDIKQKCFIPSSFSIAKLLPACNKMVLLGTKNLSFVMAAYLFNRKYTSNLSALETSQLLQEAHDAYGIDVKEISNQLLSIPLNWEKVETIETISNILLTAIKNDLYDELEQSLNTINDDFQTFINKKYFSTITSSAVQRPKIVNKVLPYLTHQHQRGEKVALLVVDGMSYWQYLILHAELQSLGIKTENNVTFSWIPSITKLSRQAIFRGESPLVEYSQSPQSENALWMEYWTSSKRPANKRFASYEVGYEHGSLVADNTQFLRYALVDVDLDEKMHSSSNTKDLFVLTKNWAEIAAKDIKSIHDAGYQIYITTDHGNILSKPWRSLTSIEKTFLYEKESRGSRHLIYSSQDYLENFIADNSDIKDSLLIHDQWAVWTDTRCFNNKGGITHGGAHFLEVVIPFITINKK